MKIETSIFRQYDIRGVVDDALTEGAVEQIGRAFGTMLSRRGGRSVSVGRDCRAHSDRLARALFSGICSTGVDVVDFGVVTTPMQYFSLHHFGLDGGVQITGSHNPPEYNGLKLCLGTDSMHGEQIGELREMIERDDFVSATSPGRVAERDVVTPYVEYCVSNIHLGSRPLTVVVDAGNGTAGPFVVPILEQLGVRVLPLFCQMDATFPNHHPDPTVEENLADLKNRVLETRADVGIAFDGDADRIGAVDERGGVLWGDQLMILFSRSILAAVPGATIVSEVKCSQTMYDDIRARGGRGIMWKTGHSLIKAKMKEVGALLAGEMSGHIFFKHRFFGFDDGIYPGLRLLEILSQTTAPLSSLLPMCRRCTPRQSFASTAPTQVPTRSSDGRTHVEALRGHRRRWGACPVQREDGARARRIRSHFSCCVSKQIRRPDHGDPRRSRR